MSNPKRNALILLSIVGLLTVILAMSASNVVLFPAQPVSFGRPNTPLSGPAALPLVSDWAILIFRGIMGLALIVLPICIVYSLLTPEGRRRLLTYIVLLMIVLFVADYLHSRSQQTPD